ncbi:MAG: hypothetical protein AVDCRST_MAG13-3829 [uncultured Solirubrobacteraceae bacterium]|uniref:Uncharacterized protein n=1 Tax=uncultured Solirubrobacteraceae bacterium TaxID=1162706 RepID=A0A6J4TM43_9ACTN|nr:MAG: hypothetical protein AVDCRST_MAG13-3829 [uncultured Solirubrobacteraceae bacterium]
MRRTTTGPGGDLRVRGGNDGQALDRHDVPRAGGLAVGLSRMGGPPPICARRRRRPAARHPRGPPRSPRRLRQPAPPRRARPGGRRAPRAQARRTAHAGGEPVGAGASPARQDHDPGLYLVAVKTLLAAHVGWAMDSHMRTELVLESGIERSSGETGVASSTRPTYPRQECFGIIEAEDESHGLSAHPAVETASMLLPSGSSTYAA